MHVSLQCLLPSVLYQTVFEKFLAFDLFLSWILASTPHTGPTVFDEHEYLLLHFSPYPFVSDSGSPVYFVDSVWQGPP